MKCAIHPAIETELRCGKCGKPICPKCMVMTPVGARCRDCAGLKRLPTYEIPPAYYLRAAGAGVGAGIVIGFLWYLVLALLPFAGFFTIIIAGAAGYGIGAVIGLAVNKKRGWGLAIIGAGSFLLSYFVYMTASGFSLLGLFFLFTEWAGLYQIVALVAGVLVAISQLR